MHPEGPSSRGCVVLSLFLAVTIGCGKGGGDRPRPPVVPDRILINEVGTGEPDFLELVNPTENQWFLGGWLIGFYDDGQLVDIYTVPPWVEMPGGSHLILYEGLAVDVPPDRLYLRFDLPWQAGYPLEVALMDSRGAVIDYIAVSTNGTTPNLAPPDEFTGSIDAAPGEDDIFRFGMGDVDDASDFRLGPAPGSPGRLNPGQGGPVSIETPDLPDAYVGSPYTFPLKAEGGTPPYRWEVTTGALPSLFTLDPKTGVLANPGPVPGSTSTFSVRVTDSFKPDSTAFATFTLTVNNPPAGSPPAILVNEIATGEWGWVEILNPTDNGAPADLEGWTIRIIQDPGWLIDYVIPGNSIVGDGEALLVRAGFGADGARLFYSGLRFPWSTPGRGACALLDPTGVGVDYLNWNGPFAPHQPPGVNWIGTIDATGTDQVLWRNSISDSDTPAEWAVSGGGTPGVPNPGQ